MKEVSLLKNPSKHEEMHIHSNSALKYTRRIYKKNSMKPYTMKPYSMKPYKKNIHEDYTIWQYVLNTEW